MASNTGEPFNIFLIGPMGVGKTTIGRQLSRKLGLPFYDSDQEIENRTGADIAWIFDVEGEKGFRQREKSVIDDLTRRSGIILSTGGGSVLASENRRNLAARGFVIFLDTSVEIQLKRTAKDKKRPLLQQKDRRGVLEQLRQERLQLYEDLADFKVFVGESSSKKVVNTICERLEEGYQV